MNYNDIVSRIQKGESVEAIAKEFTDNLNKAQDEVARQKVENVKNKKKDELAATIAQALNEYMMCSDVQCEKLRAEDVRELIDEMLPLINSLKDIKVKVMKTAPKASKSFDDIFGDFFKELGI